eukprot:g11082.t1
MSDSSKKSSIEKTDSKGYSAILHAVTNGHQKVVSLLQEQEATLSLAILDEDGRRTALMLVAFGGKPEAMRCLLSYIRNQFKDDN